MGTMTPQHHPSPDEANWQQRPMELVPSSFLTGPDGEPMTAFKPTESIVRRFSRSPSLGDAGFIRTGGGAFVHQSLNDDLL